MQEAPFGEHLRREREMRGVTLEEVSIATRISTRFLEALEKEQWEQLPGGIFNRGFIRSVARFLGLDEENLIAEYDLATQGNHGTLLREETAAALRSGRFGVVAILATMGAVLAAGGLVYQHYGSRTWGWMKASPPSTASPTEPASAPMATVPSDSKAVGARSAAVNPPGDTVSSTGRDILELKVEVGKPADIRVVADGKTVFSGRLPAGAAHSFHAREKFFVSASESSAILLDLNGQTVPPLGPPGQPGSVTLTRSDLKKVEGGLH